VTIAPETGAVPGVVGRPVRRVEDERFITGRGEYVGDITREGQVFARIVRSPVAHGRLRKVHLDAARSRDGVVGAFAATDIPNVAALRIPLRLNPPPKADLVIQPVLAHDRVRYVGEPMAVVVATDQYTAEDAAEEVWAEIDELDPVLDPVEAALGGRPFLHDGVEDNVAGTITLRYGDDLDAIFRDAEVVVRERFYMHRHTAVPMETRGLVAEVGADGRLTVWGPTKVKHFNMAVLGSLLALPPERIRFVEPDVGGGFGPRGEFYPEDFLIPWLALRLGLPVKWIEDRSENLVALNHSREAVYEAEVAATTEGGLLAIRTRAWCGLGGYLRTSGFKIVEISGRHVPGPYAWQAFEAVTHGVMTTKTPSGTFRGPGEVEPAWVRERMVDLVAERVGLDPAEVRLRNLIPAESLPYAMDVGPETEPLVYESGDYEEQLRGLLEHADYAALRATQAAKRAAGELFGVGVACTFSEGNYGPFEWARVTADAGGAFTGYVGTASLGQGVQTALAQLLADAIGVPLERVRVSHHDTDLVTEGVGAYADRSTGIGGSALLLAVDDLKRQALAAAAAQFGVEEGDLELAGDRVGVRGGPQSATLGELAAEGTGRFETESIDFAFCASLGVVAVDAVTGRVEIEKYVGAYDVGRTINPMIVQGQLAGAAAQGLSGALFEELVYDESGQPLSTSLMDCLVPTAAELPEIESLVYEYPTRENLVGAKGAGNSGVVGTHATVANAVADALGPAGRRLTRGPLVPDRVRALLREGAA
jgi:carbon-monoxide dehydrogenase large subunit